VNNALKVNNLFLVEFATLPQHLLHYHNMVDLSLNSNLKR